MFIKNNKCFCQSSTCDYFKDNVCTICNLKIIGTSACESYTNKEFISDYAKNDASYWIEMRDDDGVYHMCSNCGRDIPRVVIEQTSEFHKKYKSIEPTNYCPYCGKKMRI